MSGGNAVEIYIGLAIFIGLFLFVRQRKSGFNVISNLYLHQFYFNPTDTTVLYIKGRNRGFWARLKMYLSIGTEYSMRVTHENVFFETSTLAGNVYTSLPLTKINIIQAGFAKIIVFLVLGVLFLSGSILLLFAGGNLAAFAIVTLAVSLYSFYSYWRSRVIEITVSTGEGFWGFRFFEAAPNVRIDANLIYYTVHAINDLSLTAQGGHVAAPAGPAPFQAYH